ncbi:MAG: hypothetical protein Unbinned1446contig1005_13 [Prokaryotic dsDNA virus sp.]|nr:MAG: hypothetical protein Unbinned1446contig1005_13 [Prokaryotic dsDNA virus sp.]|tara:strand:+ start:1089 stop:1316 length:228 start_codon:yes stop_codon:yes gene_type:complete
MNYIQTFEDYYDVRQIQKAYDKGETLIIDTWVNFIEVMGGQVANAYDAMEDIEYEYDIFLEVSDYNDVVIHYYGE